MPKLRTWTDDQLIDAVKESTSITKVVLKLGLVMSGGSHSLVKKRIKNLNLDTSHFKGQGWNKNNYKFKLEDALIKNSPYYTNCQFKKRLRQAELLDYICAECGLLPDWNGKELVLQLDHINGINNDNRLENLRFLCPNCHSQTSTYAGRNTKGIKKVLI